MQSYKLALKQYAETGKEKYLYRVKSMEHDMLSPYYAALTLGMVDFKQYIIDNRKKYGVAWEDVE